MKTFIILCFITLLGHAQPLLQWSSQLNLSSSSDLLTIKTGQHVFVGVNNLGMLSSEGDSLWVTPIINFVNINHRGVDDLNYNQLIITELNSLKVFDYQGNFLRKVDVPTTHNADLQIWVDTINQTYLVAEIPDEFEQGTLYIYNTELYLIACHNFQGQLVDFGRKGNDIFTLETLYSWSGPFNRLSRRNINYQIVDYRDFSSDVMNMAISETTIALSDKFKIRFFNHQLVAISEHDLPGDIYTPENQTVIKYPDIREMEFLDNYLILMGLFLNYIFVPMHGLAITYADGYLLAISQTGEIMWERRDSGRVYLAIAQCEDGFIISGGSGQHKYIFCKFSINNTTTVQGVNPETLGGFSIGQNYPNPFNPSTEIEFVIPKSSFVSLRVYDLLGKEVAQLVNEQMTAGKHSINFNATGLTSGVYIYKLNDGIHTSSKKMLLVK